jgi:hypothetical protein
MEASKMKTLQQILEARTLIDDAAAKPGNQPEVQMVLEQASGLLQEIKNHIILNAEQELVKSLNEDNVKLRALQASLILAAGEVDAVSDRIDKVSNTIGVLSGILAAAASVGIL